MTLNDKQTILITGGAGYIGSAVSLYLLQNNYKVIILDLKPKDKFLIKDFQDKITYIQADFGDKKILEDIFSKNNISAVMHFAAFIEVGESVKNPRKFYENNVIKSLVLLDLMVKFKIDKFIFSSSCVVYGLPKFLPLTEDHDNNPISPYGKTKLIVEMVLQDYAKAYNLNFVILRYFNAAGAWPEFNLGELHEPETHVIPLILDSAYNNKIFTIFGSNYDTKDGTCLRDYLHIRDLASAHFLALKYLEKNNNSEIFNLGTGTGYSVKDVIKTVEKVTSLKINIKEIDKRAGDPACLIADPKKAEKNLDWKPEFSNLEYIIETANWFYKNKT